MEAEKMGKLKDLSDFDKGLLVMAWVRELKHLWDVPGLQWSDENACKIRWKICLMTEQKLTLLAASL